MTRASRLRHSIAWLALWVAFLASPLACTHEKSEDDANRLGRFRLRTFPRGAKVWIDGKLVVERTPATLILREGEYHLRIQATDAEPIERTIHVVARESHELNLRIPPPPKSRLSIFSDVEGADVRINGYRRGETPILDIVVTPGPLDITVLHPDGRAKSVRAALEIGEQRHLEVFFDTIACVLRDRAGASKADSSTNADVFGRLTLGMNPEGVVETDTGEIVGPTPVIEKRMPAGSHALVLRSRDGRHLRRVTIEIGAGETAVYRFQLGRADEIPGAAKRP